MINFNLWNKYLHKLLILVLLFILTKHNVLFKALVRKKKDKIILV